MPRALLARGQIPLTKARVLTQRVENASISLAYTPGAHSEAQNPAGYRQACHAQNTRQRPTETRWLHRNFHRRADAKQNTPARLVIAPIDVRVASAERTALAGWAGARHDVSGCAAPASQRRGRLREGEGIF